jgi:hypothetical protein
MLAWARTYSDVQVSPVSASPLGAKPVPAGVTMELVQVMAGLILSRESIHA